MSIKKIVVTIFFVSIFHTSFGWSPQYIVPTIMVPVSSKTIDYQCKDNCQDMQYSYGYCEKVCSY